MGEERERWPFRQWSCECIFSNVNGGVNHDRVLMDEERVLSATMGGDGMGV